MGKFRSTLRRLPFLSRANHQARRLRHQKLFRKHTSSSSKNPFGLIKKFRKHNVASHSFSDIHLNLTNRCKFLQKKLVGLTLVLGVLVTTGHNFSINQARGASSDFTVDDTYAILAGNIDDTPSVTEGGFFLNTSGSESTSGRVGVNGTITYQVQPGDSVSAIASRFGIDSDTVLKVNNISNANRIRVGQELVILPVKGLLHTVKSSDTVETLATKYKVEPSVIIEQNNLDTEEPLLVADTKLIIPGGKVAAPVRTNNDRYIASINSNTGSTVHELGAMPDVSTPATGKLLWPTSGRITQYYHRGHYAIDVASRDKPMIVASKGGTVITASTGWNGGYGNHVIIDHGDGMQTLYAHCDYLSVAVGDEVEEGEVLGRMGNSGRVYGATGIHLHFEVRVNGIKQNPLAYL